MILAVLIAATVSIVQGQGEAHLTGLTSVSSWVELTWDGPAATLQRAIGQCRPGLRFENLQMVRTSDYVDDTVQPCFRYCYRIMTQEVTVAVPPASGTSCPVIPRPPKR